MKSKYKTIISGFLVTATVIGGVYIVSEPAIKKKVLNPMVVSKASNVELVQSQVLTIQEFRAYIDMLDYELSRESYTYKNVTSYADLLNRLHNDLEKRAVVENEIKLKDETLTKEEYTALKGGLLNKFN